MFVMLVILISIWGTGYFAGLRNANSKTSKFPSLGIGMRLLVVAPHPDDEALMAGGLMQKVLASGGEVKIVFLTNFHST